MNAFDLKIHGTGRLTGLRKKKNHYLLRIVAFQGSVHNLRCTRFDCIADTPEIKAAIQMLAPRLREQGEDGSIPVKFSLTGLRPNLFVFKRGTRKGETQVFLNAKVSQLSLDAQPYLQIPKDAGRQQRRAFALGYAAGNITMRLARLVRSG